MLAGDSAELTGAGYIYAHSSKLFDVTAGANPNWDCGGDYLCTAGPGCDGPTGLPDPLAVAGFLMGMDQVGAGKRGRRGVRALSRRACPRCAGGPDTVTGARLRVWR